MNGTSTKKAKETIKRAVQSVKPIRLGVRDLLGDAETTLLASKLLCAHLFARKGRWIGVPCEGESERESVYE